MTDHDTRRLSDYLDGELTGAERQAVEDHLTACARCRAVLDDLRGVARAAAGLEDRMPADDLWPAILERIEGPRVVSIERTAHRRRVSFSIPQLAAAVVALLVISLAAAWWAMPGGRRGLVASGRGPGVVVEGGSAPVQSVSTDVSGGYDQAIAELEQTYRESRDRLDPETRAVVERNLKIIDRAIQDTERALRADPNSTYLSNHLARTYRRKLNVLREATTITQKAI